MWRSKNIDLFSAVLFFFTSGGSLFSQCLPTAATNPGNITNNAAVGSLGWSNLLNGVSSNNSYISCGSLLGILASAQTNYIQASGFGFAIPTTATVCGIEARVERNAAGLLIGSSVTDKNVYLMKAGATVGTNHASGAGWTGSDATAVYGNNSDLWGTTWTPAQINASNFGLDFSAQMNAGLASLFLTANVDAISITVYYNTSTLPVELTSFTGAQESQTIRLQWQTASEKDHDYFDVEKMNEDYSWLLLERLPGKGNTATQASYVSYDQNPASINYYRLRQVDKHQQATLSEIISVDYRATTSAVISVYPVPANKLLYIDYNLPVKQLEVFSLEGRMMQTQQLQQEHGATVDVSPLDPGIYFLKIHTNNEVLVKRFVKQ